MKIYQIGGCVRDLLLHKEPHDIDYVVVGATVEEMLSLGYKQVGKDFPVFLHPETKDEYALARKEVKTGEKHTDFEFVFSPDITLEEDVQRRDFTFNALARDIETGKIVDYVGGIKDLEQKIIRHINSEHFGEDPLRVLRMCRFAAKLDFKIAPETMHLAQEMVEKGMISHLSGERIYKEIEKALETQHFETFIRTAKECGALKVILPEVDQLWEIPHEEPQQLKSNCGEHTMLCMQKAERLSPQLKFAVLLHHIGKLYTHEESLPDNQTAIIIEKMCHKLRIPNEYKKIAVLADRAQKKFKLLPQMEDSEKIDFVQEISDKFKNAQQMEDIITVCRCTTDEQTVQTCTELCRNIFTAVKDIHATDMPGFAQIPPKKRQSALKTYLTQQYIAARNSRKGA